MSRDWDECKQSAERAQANGDLATAELHWRAALAMAEQAQTKGERYMLLAPTLIALSDVLARQQSYEEAEKHLLRLIDVATEIEGRSSQQVGKGLNALAGIYFRTGRHALSEPLARESLGIHEQIFGPNHPEVGLIAGNLATLYQSTKRFGQAEPLYRKAIGILTRALGEDHPQVLRLKTRFAAMPSLTKRIEKAKMSRTLVMPIAERLKLAAERSAPDEPLPPETLAGEKFEKRKAAPCMYHIKTLQDLKSQSVDDDKKKK